jgi:cell division septum initiation protein DivIVA
MDQNTFINTYIDVVINSLQDYVKANLQLQTQIKVNEFVVAEKDKVISSLTQQLTENKTAEDWKTKYEAAENNYSAILGKLKHMDVLLSQVNDMKKLVLTKDAQIELLNKEIEELKSPKKVINTKTKKKDISLPIVEDKPKETTLDDF